jgi:hypothetical protein
MYYVYDFIQIDNIRVQLFESCNCNMSLTISKLSAIVSVNTICLYICTLMMIIEQVNIGFGQTLPLHPSRGFCLTEEEYGFGIHRKKDAAVKCYFRPRNGQLYPSSARKRFYIANGVLIEMKTILSL